MSGLQRLSAPFDQAAAMRTEPMTNFWDGLLLRTRVNRAFFVSLGLYALFAIAGLESGVVHSDLSHNGFI